MSRLWMILAWMLALGSAAQAHQLTFSHIDIRLQPGVTEISAQVPIQALVQQQPAVLPAGVTEQTLRSDALPPNVAASLSTLLRQRLSLTVEAKPLPLTVTAIRSVGDDIALTASAPTADGALEVRADLFPNDPQHKEFVSLYRGATLAGQYALDHSDPAFTLAAPARPLAEILLTFVREGVHHIFIGPDHILFVLALVLLGGTLWSQAKIITAFTVAHSLTLTLATLGLVVLPSHLVESVIALSIVVVGVHDLWRLRQGGKTLVARDPRAAFAFVFGLVHGFGFASVLTELELPRQALAWSLAAFNIGIELGQLTIVLIAAPVVLALGRYAPPRVANGVLTATACGVVLMGGYWFFQRAYSL